MPSIETDIIDDYNMNPITGSDRPEEFQIHNGNRLCDVVSDITLEVPWLTSEGYKWMQEDIDWCRYLLVDVALAMRWPLGRLLEEIAVAYRLFEKDDFHDPRSRIPERDALLAEVNGAAWFAVRRGVSEDEMLARVRKVVAGWKA